VVTVDSEDLVGNRHLQPQVGVMRDGHEPG
jgi:hypothetical protein